MMEPNRKHDRRITLRLTEEEFDAISNGVRTQNSQNLSDGIRKVLLTAVSTGIQEQPKHPLIGPALASGIKAEVKRIGTNVNQLTKKMNGVFKKGETVSEATLRKFIGSLDIVSQHLEDILSRIDELS